MNESPFNKDFKTGIFLSILANTQCRNRQGKGYKCKLIHVGLHFTFVNGNAEKVKKKAPCHDYKIQIQTVQLIQIVNHVSPVTCL